MLRRVAEDKLGGLYWLGQKVILNLRLEKGDACHVFLAVQIKDRTMHISEGVLSAPVLVTGAALTVAGVAVGLKKMDYEKIPQVAVLTSAFFVASLIRVPVGPSAVHLVLNGLLGLILGWAAFPAILVGVALPVWGFDHSGRQHLYHGHARYPLLLPLWPGYRIQTLRCGYGLSFCLRLLCDLA